MVKTRQLVSLWATVAELIDHLGGISPDRIYLCPPPGQATEKDVEAIRATLERRLCELVDGVLVEIAYGFRESVLASHLTAALGMYNEKRERGMLLGAGMAYHLFPGCVRRPSISFLLWDRFPNGKLPDEEIPDLAPDLAIQILRAANATREMQRALQDYFTTGVQKVWLIDPSTQTAVVYSSPTRRPRNPQGSIAYRGQVATGISIAAKSLFHKVQRLFWSAVARHRFGFLVAGFPSKHPKRCRATALQKRLLEQTLRELFARLRG